MKFSVFGNRVQEDVNGVMQAFSEVIQSPLDIALNQATRPVVYLHGGDRGPQEIIYDYIQEEMSRYIACVLFRDYRDMSRQQSVSDQLVVPGTNNPLYIYYRNLQILENSDLVILFADQRPMTPEMMEVERYCLKMGTPLILSDIKAWDGWAEKSV